MVFYRQIELFKEMCWCTEQERFLIMPSTYRPQQLFVQCRRCQRGWYPYEWKGYKAGVLDRKIML